MEVFFIAQSLIIINHKGNVKPLMFTLKSDRASSIWLRIRRTAKKLYKKSKIRSKKNWEVHLVTNKCYIESLKHILTMKHAVREDSYIISNFLYFYRRILILGAGLITVFQLVKIWYREIVIYLSFVIFTSQILHFCIIKKGSEMRSIWVSVFCLNLRISKIPIKIPI